MLRRIPLLLALGACEELPDAPEEPTPLGAVHRSWNISTVGFAFEFGGNFDRIVEGQQTGGVVDVVHELGGQSIVPEGADDIATAEVFSNETGETYWVGAEAPLFSPDSVVGSLTQLSQGWKFRKDSPNASLQFVITDIRLEAIDENGIGPTPEQCPWGWDGADLAVSCRHVMDTRILVQYYAERDDPDSRPFFATAGIAALLGFGTNWTTAVSGDVYPGSPLFAEGNFTLDRGPSGRSPTLRLISPITVEVPLDTIPVGTVFEVVAMATAQVHNRRQGESYVSAFFRDPARTAGLSFASEGLTMLEPPAEISELDFVVAPAPPCGASEPPGAGGAIQFETPSYLWPEWPGDEAWITITRTGGSEGEVSVSFAMGGGTATSDTDYEPVTTHVRFADGESGTRAVRVPILQDTIAEADETVSLTLSSTGGCATLGGPTTAELIIMDDDQPLPDRAHTVGGTVSGLEGSGLVLTNLGDLVAVTANGPFVFDPEYADGLPYEVRVATQPTDPGQTCSVSNGSGTIAGADVTDIEVTCAPPPDPEDDLDPGFGQGGKVTSEIVGGAVDVALQSDGGIIVVDDRSIARYLPDGTPDPGFGLGGVVNVQFLGLFDRVRSVAVQPDDRIVVAGYTRENATHDNDWAVARYNTDGSLDTSFAGHGVIITDIAGLNDQAEEVAIQPDGAIVAAGRAGIGIDIAGRLDTDFGVARFTSAGDPDPTFANGSFVTRDVVGNADLLQALVLEADGRIVVGGRVALEGTDDPDIGLMRYNADGTVDPAFSTDGIQVSEEPGWQEVTDLVVQPDGGILTAGFHFFEGLFRFLVFRFGTTGSSEGDLGEASLSFSDQGDYGRAISVLADGRIVVAGQSSNLVAPDFAIARLHPDGSPDSSFGTDGKLTIDFFGARDGATALAVQPDGAVIVVGEVLNGTRVGLGMVRIRP